MPTKISGSTGVDKVQDGVVGDAALNLSANSQEIKDALNASGSAPIYACRAWVNFNGQGTPAIRASGNVSSITDNGAGDYTVNFTTAMPDTNYSAPASVDGSGVVSGAIIEIRVHTTTSVKVRGMNPQSGYANTDFPVFSLAIFR